ncbi:MAG: GGDEF domain-containing protein [Phycisphaerales bacterium]
MIDISLQALTTLVGAAIAFAFMFSTTGRAGPGRGVGIGSIALVAASAVAAAFGGPEPLIAALCSGGVIGLAFAWRTAVAGAVCDSSESTASTSNDAIIPLPEEPTASTPASPETGEYVHADRIDEVTGLYSRPAWEEAFSIEQRRCELSGASYGIVLIELDDFRELRYEFGDRQADDCMRLVSRRVNESCRPVDIVGRYDDERIIVLVPESTVARTILIGQRIQEAIRDLGFERSRIGRDRFVTVCVGLAVGGSEPWRQAIQRARDALIEARSNGVGRVCMRAADAPAESAA